MSLKKGVLVLEGNESFEGDMPDWQEGMVSGEVVFTTGMCGYPESLTDPSFAGQILVFTYPLIGNYGAPLPSEWESKKIHVKGVVVAESAPHFSHHGATTPLEKWLKDQNVFLLTGVDTRAITKVLRKKGTPLGAIADRRSKLFSFDDPSERNIVKEIVSGQKRLVRQGKKRVIVVDCGMKESILNELATFDLELLSVPFDYDYTQEEYDGVFLSNGPGDPTQCQETIEILKKALVKKKPIFGICLGSQLLSLAAGAHTYKLKFGHRGQNQPCIDVDTKKCYITAQNHGYAVEEASLPKGWKVTFRNLNDDSVEGIAHESDPFQAVQFHPEAAPGPSDTRFLFERFVSCL